MKGPKGTELFQMQLCGPPRLEKPAGIWSLAADQIAKVVSFPFSVQTSKLARSVNDPSQWHAGRRAGGTREGHRLPLKAGLYSLSMRPNSVVC